MGNNTTLTEEYINGHKCIKCTGSNGNYIIIPEAGSKSSSGDYGQETTANSWSSTPYDGYNSRYMNGLYNAYYSRVYLVAGTGDVSTGMPVRPVIG